MTAHTPGEWEIRGGFTPEHTCIIGQTGDVIDSFGKPKKSNGEPISIEEHRANARLIAAAPELLEACKAWIKHHNGQPDYQKELQLAKITRTAIRKAKGA